MAPAGYGPRAPRRRGAVDGTLTCSAVRRSTAIRAAACTALAAGVAPRSLAAGCGCRRPSRSPPPRRRRSRCASLVPRSRARDVGDLRAADVGLPRGLQDAQRRSGGARARACTSTTPCASTAGSGAGTPPTLRLQRALGTPGGFRALGEGARLVALGLVLVPARDRRVPAAAPSRAFPRGAAQIYATFDIGLIGYWAVPTAPPWYAAAQGLMERRPHAGAAADDGRVRRAVLEVRLGAAVRCPGGQSPRRHAVAALRHLRDGRARALPRRAASPARWAGPTR